MSTQESPVNHHKGLLKSVLELSSPLVLEVSWYDNQNSLREISQFELLDYEAGHDGLSCAGIVSDQEADSGKLQYVAVDRFNLVRQWIYLGSVHSQERVVEGCVSVP